MKEYNVFVSYSRKDDINFLNDTGIPSPVDQILKRFEKEGISPWIDREGKYCGAAFQKEILRALDNSELVLFISSANSNSEDAFWVFREVNYAAEMKMKILPLLLDETPFNDEIKLIFSGKDRNEYYKNPTKGLNDLVGSIKKHIEDIRKKEKAEAEETARRKKIEEEDRKRKEAEEQKRIEKLEKEITGIKKRIVEYVEKQQACMKDLLSKEKDLNKSSDGNMDCPVCQTPITDIEVDYCDICGWHFATPKEFVSLEMQDMYEKRLHASQTIWTEKQQKKEEIESLKKEKDILVAKKDETEKELADYRNKYYTYLEDSKKQIQAKQAEANKFDKELKEARLQLTKSQQKITELSKKFSEKLVANQSCKDKRPIAFLLVTEFDQTNVYCLYEGKNVFGAKQANANQTDYQMLVVSDNNLNAQHFEIGVFRENKRFVYSVSPNNESCILALNSPSNVIKTKNNIQINDMLFIGEVKIQIIDNFNKNI